MLMLVAGLVVFLGTHSVSIVAPAARDRWAASLGHAWRLLYSVVALAGFALVVHGYAAARAAPVPLYMPPAALRHAVLLLMLPVFPLLFAAYLPGRIRDRLKHPMLVAVKLWATSHLLANGMLADVVLFGSFLAWAVVDRISLKRRAPRPVPTAPRASWNDAAAVVLGLGAYAAFLVWLHPRLIGVAVIPGH